MVFRTLNARNGGLTHRQARRRRDRRCRWATGPRQRTPGPPATRRFGVRVVQPGSPRTDRSSLRTLRPSAAAAPSSRAG